ncbi:hypothetical protein BOTBODRAFT_188975 [Botryobasidium botryosum FD-172 SS1]|uniref:Uncharacterized protein n=1 Tax=Botryobasidium botryosum (strain FD-172 SS1) TaxID=930990 RepID=A0A067MLC7_BOTB1|nr:hypothetical protein BOTBODRAFT_188975 [Botryobasidium botryosum FD-172 SS1]
MAATDRHTEIDESVAYRHTAPSFTEEKFHDEKHPAADSVISEVQYDNMPTEEEKNTLRRIPDTIPIAAWLIVFVEFAERFSWYGTTGPMTNYVQQPLPPGSVAGNVLSGHTGVAGALGQGQRTSTALANFRQFFTYCTPILGAILADTKWGRFKAICIFYVVCLVGHIILVFTSIPSSLKHAQGALAGFVISVVIMGLGTGGIKSNISPLVAEQAPSRMRKETLKTGETVVVDPTLTTQRIFLYFYMMINAGSLASLSTTFAEKHVGFWLAYALPTILYLFIPPILWYGNKIYVKTPPRGSIILESWRVFVMAARGKWSFNPITLVRNFKRDDFWDTAKPSYYAGAEHGPLPKNITWDDEFVDEVFRALKACKVFAFYPLYWISYDQMTANLTSQAATMELHGVPNEIVNNLNPLSLVIMIPIMERVIYPGLRKMKINFTPIKRITMGFMFGALAMVYTTVLQHYIYKKGPCGKFPSTCVQENGDPWAAPFNVWLQSPAYVLTGISEIFASITGLEYAYTKAPERMRSVVMSIFLFQSALASALEFTLVTVSVDPYLDWMYAGVGITSFVSGIIFYFTFRKLDREEDTLNAIGKVGEREGFVETTPQKS